VLDLVHALVNLGQTPVGPAHPDRQRQEHQPEFVVELAGDRLIQRTQV
jgi:hypothetical protein